MHPGVSNLSCRPDTVHVLRAQSAFSSQEVQDDLTLFNDLGEKKQAGRSKKTNGIITQFILDSTYLDVQIRPKYVLDHIIVDQPISELLSY